ncbi:MULTISPECIES: YoaK family protein [unclassified Mycolicibacterium]|uniref:YoaK family protein n=1 Tax=unclassified Mycolicibacterium TaxID=2636767 RepID=UPI002ED9F23B
MSGRTDDTARTATLWFALLLTLTNGFLDAHTYFTRGQVFANVQTGNVIFLALDLSDRHVGAALAHLWPILAFIVGVSIAAHIKSGRAEQVLPYPLRWTMAIQVVALAVIGFVPGTVSHTVVTVPISLLAAVQIGLFRNIGDLAYLPVATTGNLMRCVESGYAGFVEGSPDARRATGVYAALILAFAGGAVIGGVASRAWGVHAIWLAAGILAVTLLLFIVDRDAVA